MANADDPNELPLPETVEYDPAFDYAEESVLDDDEEIAVVDAEGNVVIPVPPVLPDEERPVPLDDDFRGTE